MNSYIGEGFEILNKFSVRSHEQLVSLHWSSPLPRFSLSLSLSLRVFISLTEKTEESKGLEELQGFLMSNVNNFSEVQE